MEIKVVRQIMEWNEDCSGEIKSLLKDNRIFMVNVMGSPGAGKTSLTIELAAHLAAAGYRVGVIEGDVAGQIDARRIAALGLPVVQLNTEGACHIEAMSVKHILPYFDLNETDVLIVENIGNLVCPAEFNIGEDLRLALLSVPEGDDKVEKYPLMFSVADALILHKFDMKPHFDFDDEKVEAQAKAINRDIGVFRVSVPQKAGLAELAEWLLNKIAAKLQ
ncbi:MAG: hydrogenase nickel incorporation protein HypB [Clostridiales bacterium]|nr:hydrogenase nickel incorporation protein HypB [Clostridiales bacterium]